MDVTIRAKYIWIHFIDSFIVFDYKRNKIMDKQIFWNTCGPLSHTHMYDQEQIIHYNAIVRGMVHNSEYLIFEGIRMKINEQDMWFKGDKVCEYGSQAFVYDCLQWQVVELNHGQVIQSGKFDTLVNHVSPMTKHRLLVATKDGTFVMC